jgi:pyruvate dehydrogenase E2 component (dihydrolipoamide acetyltransferase)
MARWEFKLPDIGEGVSEGEIVSWLVKPGDVVVEDQPMVEVMTDKATVTIGAPRAGSIVETRGTVGDVVPVHGVLVVFELDARAGVSGADGTTQPAPKLAENGRVKVNGTTGKSEEGPAATAVGDIREDLPGMGPPPSVTLASRGPVVPGLQGGLTYFNAKPLATPATRKMAREMNVDLKQVPPTGPQGRTTKDDVETFMQGAPTLRPVTPAARLSPGVTHGSLEERVPFAGLRRKIAQKMALSKRTAAHFTFVEECDVTALKAMRTRLKVHAEAAGVKLTYLPFIVKACVAALKRHPILNSTLDEPANELVYRRYYNIGVATATDAGLIVPVVKDADLKTILEIARDIDRVADDAKSGRVKAEDLTGSTFTITSLGAQSGLLATPILNFPEVGILGVHRMKERPVVRNGQIVIGDVMLVSLSFDHRIVDGHVGAAFAYEIIGYLEDPDKLLLEMR